MTIQTVPVFTVPIYSSHLRPILSAVPNVEGGVAAKETVFFFDFIIGVRIR